MLAASVDDVKESVARSVETASALVTKCGVLRAKVRQLDGLAQTTAELKKQLDFMVWSRGERAARRGVCGVSSQGGDRCASMGSCFRKCCAAK